MSDDTAAIDGRIQGIRVRLEAGEYRNREDFGDTSINSAEGAISYLLAHLEAPAVVPPASSSRPETGPMKFGDDWTGVFMRGDTAAGYYIALKTVLGHPGPFTMEEAMLHGLLGVLRSSNERVGYLSDTQVMRPFAECSSSGPSSPRSPEGSDVRPDGDPPRGGR
jgi:hypothetical protein